MRELPKLVNKRINNDDGFLHVPIVNVEFKLYYQKQADL